MAKKSTLEADVEEAARAEEVHGYEQKIAILRNEISGVKRDNKLLHSKNDELQSILDLVQQIEEKHTKPAPWSSPRKSSKSHVGVINLMLSDLHLDEVVDPEEIEHLNAYDRSIAEGRLRRCVEKTIMLSRDYISGVKYEGMSLMLGGDMISGWIHEELSETNEAPVPETVDYWLDPLSAAVGSFVEEYGKVHVSGVVGNHGRVTKKPRAKKRVTDNIDWLIYRMLMRDFRNDDRVTWQLPYSSDCLVPTYDTKVLMTHGDQFRGGSGIAGLLCLDPSARVLTADCEWVEQGDLQVGDLLVGCDEEGNATSRRKFTEAKIEEIERGRMDVIEIDFSNGTSVRSSLDHPWLVRPQSGDSTASLAWRETKDLRLGDMIVSLGPPMGVEQSREAGWLAAIYDGEGSVEKSNSGVSGRIQLPQNEGPVLDEILRVLDHFGFHYVDQTLTGDDRYTTPHHHVRLVGPDGGRKRFVQDLRFLTQISPVRLRAQSQALWDGLAVNAATTTTVTGMRFEGEQEVVGMKTSTGTFVAEGQVTHNSPMMIGVHRKSKRAMQTDSNFDYLVMGHWHQLSFFKNVMVNGCFPAGSRVATPNGPSPIETIKTGSEVISRDGSAQKVTHVFERESESGLVGLKMRGLPNVLWSTPNHLVWAMKGNSRNVPPSRRALIDSLTGKPQWIPSEFLSPGDFVQVPSPKGTERPVDLETAWAYGLFLAEGHATVDGGSSKKHHRVHLTMHERERDIVERWARWFEETFGVAPHIGHRKGKHTTDLYVSAGRDNASWFQQTFGHGAKQKHCPEGTLFWDADLKAALVGGWVTGDGHSAEQTDCRPTVSATTISERMAWEMFHLAASLESWPTLACLKAGGRRKNDAFTVHFNVGQDVEVVNGEAFYKVIERFGSENVVPVFDLEVSGEHTYDVEGVGVHNSLKGYDEYAYLSNFDYEPAQQALWLTTPENGITFQAPVLVEDRKKEGW